MSPKNSHTPFAASGPSGDEPTGQGEGMRIYGKDGWLRTKRARAALPRARFIDVLAEPAALEEMLRLSGGVRRIPVIANGHAVEIGFMRGA